MERKKAQRKRNVRRKAERIKWEGRLLYAVGVLGLAALVVCAFFLPKLLFSMRDSQLCKDIVLGEREEMDVTMLSAAYEPSLGVRLRNFTSGLAQGRTFYVSEQDMEPTQELLDLLYNDGRSLFHQQPFWVLSFLDLVDYRFISLNREFSVNIWKQYVIYSDELAEGIYFIIWYLELEDNEGEKLEVLMDAEDYTFYGLASKQNLHTALGDESLSLLVYYSGQSFYEWWYAFEYYYQCISEETLDDHYQGVVHEANANIYDKYTYEISEEVANLEAIWRGGEALELPDDDTCILHLPCGEQFLDFSVRIQRNTGQRDSGTLYDSSGNYAITYYNPVYPDSYIGLDDICRLIPEFLERF